MKPSKINLDLTNTKAESDSTFNKVPAGAYKVSLAYSQFKDGKKPGAAGLQVGYMIESGDHKGKLVGEYINIMNDNAQAVEIGHGRLRKICELQGRKSFKLTNDTDLINRTVFAVDVDVEVGEYNGKPQESNRVKKIYASETTPKEEAKAIKKVQDTVADEEVREEKTAKLPWE